MSAKYKLALSGVLVFCLFVIDRVLKFLFYKKFPQQEFFILSDWLKLKLAFNPGIAFGLAVNYYLIIFIYILILLALIWWLIKIYREKKYFSILCLQMVIAGAFSNLLDRLQLGQVIDYFDLKYYSVFNLADVMIVCGVVGLLVVYGRKRKPPKQ
ncbi:MAG: signal peptidase II [bacterium]